MSTQTFPVTGMTCGHCVSAVSEELRAVDGVSDVDVELVPGGTSQVTVRADVTLRPDPAGGLRISSSKITVRGTADGVDNDAFVKAAEAAKVGCPVSKALTGTEITLDAALG